MFPRSKTVVLIEKRLRDEIRSGAVESDRVAVVDLNGVDTLGGPN